MFVPLPVAEFGLHEIISIMVSDPDRTSFQVDQSVLVRKGSAMSWFLLPSFGRKTRDPENGPIEISLRT